MNKSQLHQPSYEIFYLPFEISHLHDKIQYTVIQINTVKDALKSRFRLYIHKYYLSKEKLNLVKNRVLHLNNRFHSIQLNHNKMQSSKRHVDKEYTTQYTSAKMELQQSKYLIT